ncbi:hypothetical protein U1Q18_049562 [Sarracenia purpurea var. burkii]
MGKLLEDLDALAGTISYKIVLKKPIRVDTDLILAGSVTWVGQSSMEIQLEVTQSSDDSFAETSNPSDSVALTANFTFVACDLKTGKAALVNQILPETERENMLWQKQKKGTK